jgi:hypothetical protein
MKTLPGAGQGTLTAGNGSVGRGAKWGLPCTIAESATKAAIMIANSRIIGRSKKPRGYTGGLWRRIEKAAGQYPAATGLKIACFSRSPEPREKIRRPVSGSGSV